MSVTAARPIIGQGEQAITLHRIGWDQYRTIADALPERGDLRIIYLDGSLTLLTTSRRHDWFAERLGDLVEAIATGLEIPWEDAGTATFRREDAGAGVEGDKTFYFGANADRMQGPQDIDLSTQPPPDLAVEVEVSDPADQALLVWGRLGVPEVWRFEPGREHLGFWRRRDDGIYEAVARSVVLPHVEPADILEQLGSRRGRRDVALASAGLVRVGPRRPRPSRTLSDGRYLDRRGRRKRIPGGRPRPRQGRARSRRAASPLGSAVPEAPGPRSTRTGSSRRLARSMPSRGSSGSGASPGRSWATGASPMPW